MGWHRTLNRLNNLNKMDFLNYTDWQATADTLHLLLQITGKVKLAYNPPRPEWAHIRQYVTLDGITTGVVPHESSPFAVHFNFRQDQVEFRTVKDEKATVIKLEDGKSVGAYYRQFVDALKQMDADTDLCVHAQEFYEPVELDKDEKHHTYSHPHALLWLENMLYAYQALCTFIAPFRGKVAGPAYYFGDMDLSCAVYSGEAAPYEKQDKVIKSVALDERCYICGYWPGDPTSPEPAFYAMPYPFIRDLKGNEKFLRPDKAFFQSEKQVFFFKLKDALNYPNPHKMIADFYRSGFDLIQEITRCKNLDWITRPLEYKG